MNHAITNLYPKPAKWAGNPISGANVTVSTSVTTLSSAYVNVAAPQTDPIRYISWQVQGGTIYLTTDGTTPTASNGFQLVSGTANTWHLSAFLAAKAITSSSTAVFRWEGLMD